MNRLRHRKERCPPALRIHCLRLQPLRAQSSAVARPFSHPHPAIERQTRQDGSVSHHPYQVRGNFLPWAANCTFVPSCGDYIRRLCRKLLEHVVTIILIRATTTSSMDGLPGLRRNYCLSLQSLTRSRREHHTPFHKLRSQHSPFCPRPPWPHVP